MISGVAKPGRVFFSVGIGTLAFIMFLANTFLWFVVYATLHSGASGIAGTGIVVSLATIMAILLSYIVGEVLILVGSRIIKFFKKELDPVSLRLEISKIEKSEVQMLLDEYLQKSELFSGVGAIGLLSTISAASSLIFIEVFYYIKNVSSFSMGSLGISVTIMSIFLTCAFIPSVFYAKIVLKQHSD